MGLGGQPPQNLSALVNTQLKHLKIPLHKGQPFHHIVHFLFGRMGQKMLAAARVAVAKVKNFHEGTGLVARADQVARQKPWERHVFLLTRRTLIHIKIHLHVFMSFTKIATCWVQLLR